MFNPVATYRYLLPNLYLSVADISNPDLFVCGSRTWISLDIARFYEEHFQTSSGSTWPACPKTVIGPPLLGAGGSIQFAQVCQTAVTISLFIRLLCIWVGIAFSIIFEIHDKFATGL